MSTKIIIFAVVAIAIIYVVYYKSIIKTKKETFKKVNHTDLNYDYDPNKSLDGMCLYDTKPESLLLNTYPLSGEQSLFSMGTEAKPPTLSLRDRGDNHYYISESYGCEKPVKSIKQFHDEFFKFRDHIHGSSSMRYDPVDKMMNMKLDGDLSKNDAKHNSNNSPKIKDIYDNLTAGVKQYSKIYENN